MIGYLEAIRSLQKELNTLKSIKLRCNNQLKRKNLDKKISERNDTINILKTKTDPFIYAQEKHIQIAIRTFYYEVESWSEATTRGEEYYIGKIDENKNRETYYRTNIMRISTKYYHS